MIKLKKIIALSVLIFGLYSCTKDEASNNSTNSIEGKWEDYKKGEIIDGKEVLEDNNSTGCTKNYIEILAGGTIKDYSFNNQKSCEQTVSGSRWTKDNNTFTITGSNSEGTYTHILQILELSSTTLKLQRKYTDNGNEITLIIILKRI